MATKAFRHQRRFQHAKATATVALVDDEARHAEFAHRLPHILGARLQLFGEASGASQRRVVAEQARDAVGEQGLLFGQSEIHAAAPQASFGSRGMPRPRSAMASVAA